MPSIDAARVRDADHVVVVSQGILCAGIATLPVVEGLSSEGIYVINSGRHINFGPTYSMIRHMTDLIKNVTDIAGKPIVGFGHSKGGFGHALVDMLEPGHYELLITAASPTRLTMADVHKSTNIGFIFIPMQKGPFKRRFDHGTMDLWAQSKASPPSSTPVLAFIAGNEAVVSPEACFPRDDAPHQRVYIIESSHDALPRNQSVLDISRFHIVYGLDKELPDNLVPVLWSEEDLAELLHRNPAEVVGDYVVKSFKEDGHPRHVAEATYNAVESTVVTISRGLHDVKNAPARILRGAVTIGSRDTEEPGGVIVPIENGRVLREERRSRHGARVPALAGVGAVAAGAGGLALARHAMAR